MPRILEDKLKREYPNNPHAVFGTLNKIGAMKGNKETSKGKAMERALENKKDKKVRKEKREHDRMSYAAEYGKGFRVTHSRRGKEGIEML